MIIDAKMGRKMYTSFLVLLIFLTAQALAASSIHTVFTTECGAYFTWQSMGMIYSHKKSGQPGPLTRIMSCTPEDWESLTPQQRSIVKTHVAPSYTKHPKTGDHYSAYNKPVAVIDWLARNNVTEDYVLIIDADMIMRSTFVPEDVGARPGRAVSAYFGYMKGVNNKLALKHVPEVKPRKDTLAGPAGRRGDQVGGFTLMNTNDLRRVAPLWLKYTEDVRADPDAWELTGDAFTKNPGEKPWISEMYGYSYACSKSNVWHLVHHSAMLYPGYETLEPPKVLHYGLFWEVSDTGYKFDKHWHYDFDPFKCPPWNLEKDAPKSKKGGLFPHPPRASSFSTTGFKLLRDLLSIEVVVTLNQAFCDHHREHCPPSEELEKECKYVDEYGAELVAALANVENDLPDPCQDLEPRCARWAKEGECDGNAGYMLSTCALSCKTCRPRSPTTTTNKEKKAPRLTHEENSETVNEINTKDKNKIKKDTANDVDNDGEIDIGMGNTQAEIDQQADNSILDAGSVLNEETHQKIEDEEEEQRIKDADVNGDVQENIKESIKESGDTVQNTKNAESIIDGAVDIDIDSGLYIPELKLRCTRFPRWNADQIKRCMTLANEGVAYDPSIDDPDAAASAAELHAQAHRLIGKTHDVGKLLGEGLSNVHLRENAGRATIAAQHAAERIGVVGVIGWGGSVFVFVLLLVHLSRRRRNGGGNGNGGQYGRHSYKYSRVSRDD